MKRLLIITLMLAVIVCPPALAQAEFKKTKVAIIDFQIQGNQYENSDMGAIVAEWLITALVKDGRFDVVERRLLKKVLGEQQLVMTGVVNEASASELGKLLGVKIIISGTVMSFQNVLEVNARIIDVTSASIITAENVKSTTAIRLEELVMQMAEKIIKDFPLEGYVVSRTDQKVSIDLGRYAGVKAGMRFSVFREGSIIKHPKTGEVLDIERIQTGKIEITKVRDNIAEARIMEEVAPQTVAYGQMVRSLSQPQTDFGKYTGPSAFDSGRNTELMRKLSELDPKLEDVKRLKAAGNVNWEIRIKEALVALKYIYAQNPTAPEVWFYYAKAFGVAGNLRKTNKSLAKALYFDPEYIEALVFKGDINFEYGKKIGSKGRKLAPYAIQGYEGAANSMQDRAFKAQMYYRIGEVYDELTGDSTQAAAYWQRAVDTAPGSQAGQQAAAKLAHAPTTGSRSSSPPSPPAPSDPGSPGSKKPWN